MRTTASTGEGPGGGLSQCSECLLGAQHEVSGSGRCPGELASNGPTGSVPGLATGQKGKEIKAGTDVFKETTWQGSSLTGKVQISAGNQS